MLLEGLPGLGKTELVKGIAGFLGLDFRRIQFTPDLLPGDITGGPVLEEGEDGTRRFVFHPGPIFGNTILADEINRASPRTQSALLEAMQERRVTVLGTTHTLPRPFWVLATQNPIELEGTFPLPEAQLDRFLFKLQVTRVGAPVLQEILTNRRRGAPPPAEPVTDAEGLRELFDTVDGIYLPDAVAAYISRLVEATHPDAGPRLLAAERPGPQHLHGRAGPAGPGHASVRVGRAGHLPGALPDPGRAARGGIHDPGLAGLPRQRHGQRPDRRDRGGRALQHRAR